MRAEFTFDEYVYNQSLIGATIYYDDSLKTIEYVKLDKQTRQIIVHCVSGDVFTCMQDEMFDWEVTTEKEYKAPTLPRLKGRKGKKRR